MNKKAVHNISSTNLGFGIMTVGTNINLQWNVSILRLFLSTSICGIF